MRAWTESTGLAFTIERVRRIAEVHRSYLAYVPPEALVDRLREGSV